MPKEFFPFKSRAHEYVELFYLNKKQRKSSIEKCFY